MPPPTSPRLDLPSAVAAWLLGFVWIRLRGSWAPLALLTALAAARLLVGDAETRRLVRPSASGLLRVAGRSPWPAIVAHAAWDLAVLVGWPLG